MINKSYKIWIMLFITINLILLWSLGYLNFLEKKLINKDDIIIIKPDNAFKILPPKDESFPNEKSKLWQAFEDGKPEELLQMI